MSFAPRDTHNATGFVAVARTFSHVVSPPVIFAVLGLALAWRAIPGWSGLGWAALYGFWVCLAPILYVVYLLRTGRIGDISMTQRERRIPYLVGTICSVIAFSFVQGAGGPTLLRCLTLFNILALTVLGFITLFWQISHHATAITAAGWIGQAVFGNPVGWMMLGLAVVVCLNRLYLLRHTPAQLVAGVIWGTVAVWLVMSGGCF